MSERVQLCGLRVGGDHYAIDIMRVEEILHPAPVTPVPGAPAAVEGVVQLRGTVLPVVDVRRALGQTAARPLSASGRLVVCRVGQRRLGLLVDGVSGVFKVDETELKPAPVAPGGDGLAPVPGLVRHLERVYLLLDVLALLGSSRAKGA